MTSGSATECDPWCDLHQGDCIPWMAGLPAGCADLVFADPPFNIGYQYDIYNDKRSRAEYLAWADVWLTTATRLVSPTGSMFVAVGDEYVAEHKIRMDALGLTLRNWIVWHYTFGVNCSKKFSRSHAHILYYTRHPRRFTFNPDPVRVPSARQSTYQDKRANPAGKIPDDTWVLRPADASWSFSAESDTWCESRVCGTFRERVGHPCQMPESILERIIRVSTRPGELVVDPFGGSGTTLAVAKRLGRRWLGCEMSPNYAAGIVDRLKRTPQGD